MKKGGSSNSKSKIRRTSKSTPGTAKALGQALAVGHRPQSLSPQDEVLFRAFQSNLLSLISHELRTPLTGIINALTLLEEDSGSSKISPPELIKMARRNANRLHQSLVALLDLAAIESGTFHVRLKEVDLARVVKGRFEANQSFLKDHRLHIALLEGADVSPGSSSGSPALLADPQKIGQVVDLFLQILVLRALPLQKVKVHLAPQSLALSFELEPQFEEQWKASWTQSVTGFQGGLASPCSAFAGVLQAEPAFLNRSEEGLGSEFLLIHEIMRLHQGKFKSTLQGRTVSLILEFPELSSEESLKAVLSSRIYQISTQLSSVALVLIQVPETTSVSAYREKVKQSLFRASDAVYPLPNSRQIALVLDDCKIEDVPQLIFRIARSLPNKPIYGVAHCPTDSLDADLLIQIAREALQKMSENRQ